MAAFILLIVKILLLLPTSYANIRCPDPPTSFQFLFDLESLKLAAAEYSEIFQAPRQCSPGGHGCDAQICFGGEVGCCYRDSKTGKSRCGCKAREDPTCSRAPPLAYLQGSACEPNNSAGISMCLRKQKDGMGWSSGRADISKTSHVQPEKYEYDAILYIEASGTPYELVGAESAQVVNFPDNSNSDTVFLRKFTAQQLVEKLDAHVIAEIIALVRGKKNQDLPPEADWCCDG